MSADNTPSFDGVPESLVPVTSADAADSGHNQTQSAPTANGNSFKDTMVNSKVRRPFFNPIFISICKASANISFRCGTYSTFFSNKLSDTAAAINTISNHPLTQDTKETLTQGTPVVSGYLQRGVTDCALGPVAESVKKESAKTGNELSGLANSRVQPDSTAADGQPLTRTRSSLPFGCER